ncbi:MAG: ferredoxin [Trebonia sp.]
MAWRVAVDSRRCIGSGMCVGTAPDRFQFDQEQHSTPVTALIEPDDTVRDAAISCPVEAISLVDDGTGDPVPLDD